MLDLRMIMISQQSIIFKQQQEIEYLKKQVAELQAHIIERFQNMIRLKNSKIRL